MSFFNGIKRAFGFSEDEEYVNSHDEIEDEAQYNNISEPSVPVVDIQNDEIENLSIEVKTQELFDGVIKVFNDALPEYYKSCLNIEEQRKYIYNNLDDSLKTYLVNARKEATQLSEKKWQIQSNAHRNELQALQEQVKMLEMQQGEAKKLQLSAERQKRALSERVHDLESQVASFEAEKEQYQLENSCLVNKLKVANVKDGELEDLRKEIADLQMKLLQARNGDTEPVNEELQTRVKEAEIQIENKDKTIAELNALQEELKVQLNEIQTKLNASECEISKKDSLISEVQADLLKATTQNEQLLDAIDNLKKQLEEANTDSAQEQLLQEQDVLKNKIEILEKENMQLADSVQQLETKTEMAETMVANQSKNATDAIEKLAIANARIEEISEEKVNAEKEIDELKTKLQLANEELAGAQAELDEVRSNLSIIDEIEEQIRKFEEIKKKKDIQIAELKDKIAQYESETVVLREKVDELTKVAEQKNTFDESNFIINNNTEVKISAIDDSLDDINWLEPGPPKTPNKKQPIENEETFGYKAPVKKVQPENDAQMSLFE